MRFSIASVFAFVTAVAATEPYWTVEVSEHVLEEGKVQYVNAKYHSDEYPDGLRNSCYSSSVEPPNKSCDRLTFWYEYDGTTLTVQQDIELPSPVTVFGSAEVALTDRFAEDWMRGYVTVPVISSEEN